MKKDVSKWFWRVGSIVFILAFISVVIAMFSFIELLTSFRIVFGSVYVLFLPGFNLSYAFFLKTKKQGDLEKGTINWLERIALSLGLSIAIVPLVVFYLNIIGLQINLINSFLTILGVILICSAILILKKHKYKKRK